MILTLNVNDLATGDANESLNFAITDQNISYLHKIPLESCVIASNPVPIISLKYFQDLVENALYESAADSNKNCCYIYIDI